MSSTSTRQHVSPRSKSNSAANPDPQAQAVPPLAWRSWPIVDEWQQIWPVPAVLLVISASIGLVTGNYEFALLAMASTALVLWRLWLPITYEINSSGIDQTCFGRTVRTPWSAIRLCRVERDGVLLSPDAGPLDCWRGLYVPWNQHRTAVLTSLAAHIARRTPPRSPAEAVRGPKP
jgi:hypothetical protein